MTTDADLLRRLSEDRALASVLLFDHRHPQEEAPMHIQMMDAFRSADELVQVEAFREAGKTTKAEEHIILTGCYRNYNYGLLIGETYEKATQRLAAIDHELQTNEKLNRLFNGTLARKSIENKIYFRSGFFLQCHGWEQELQGFKYQAHRPDFAYLDDVENLERVRDSASVDYSMAKLYHDLLPAMDTTRYKVINGQTRRASDCMVTRNAMNEDWVCLNFPICDRDPDDPEAKSNWPQRYPMKWIRKLKRKYEAAGMLSYFLQAYMLQTVNPESQPFREDMLAELEYSPFKEWMPKYAIYDPSRTTNKVRSKVQDKSDPAGKVVVSRMGSKILVHESVAPYWKPNEFIEDLFATCERHPIAKVAIEKNSLDDWLLQPIRMEMLRRGVTLPLMPLQAPQDRNKEQFILGLQPFITAGDVVLIGGKMAHPDLVSEVKNFPYGPRGILNALAYFFQVCSGVPMYEDFSGANIGEAPKPRLGEDVYLAFNANPTEAVAVAVVREGRRLCVAADWSASGATQDAIKNLAFGVRATFPRASLQTWVPADTYDQWQRIALVPSLRAEKLTPMRGEHIAVARGCLSERMRMQWRNARLLTVDKRAHLTLNALSAEYKLPAEKGGRTGHEPEAGIARLVAEALECLVAVLDRQDDTADGFPKNANIARTPSGAAYVSANPRRA